MSGSMRDRMPECAAFIDDLRRVFGAEDVNGWITRGIRDGTFYASENGHEIGKPADTSRCVVPVLIEETTKPKGRKA